MIILDTNVFSEMLKPVPSTRVFHWLAAQESQDVFLTAITLAELFQGVEMMPSGRRRTDLHDAIELTLNADYAGRVLAFDDLAARPYAKILAGRKALGRPISQSDGMIAAIARARGFVVATRNLSDFEHCGIRVVSPWA